MRDRFEDIETIDIVVVTFTDSDSLSSYATRHEAGITFVSDQERKSYRAYGLGRGTVRRVWGLKAAKRYLEIFRDQGLSGLRAPKEDSLQLGGDFIIDSDGTLIYGFWSEGPDDRPTVDELVAALDLEKDHQS